MDLDAYRAQAQAFATDLNRAHHGRFAGLDGRWEPAAIYEAHAGVFAAPAIEALREAAEAEADPAAPMRRLLRFAVEARLGAVCAAADAERARAEAEEGLAGLTAALAEEEDLVRRVQLEEQRLDVVARRLTAPAAEALERTRAEARRLGWPSPRAMLSAIHGVDLGAVAAEAEALLRAREAPPLAAGVLARHDLPRLQRAAWADPLLPEALGHLGETIAGLGLEPGFTIDAERRASKSARAFCAAVRAPEDVHLVVAPDGGLTGLQALFHEAGHALHLSHRDPSAPFEDRHLVDRADAEAVAFAFEALAVPAGAEPALAAHLDAVELLRARRLAAALLHDLDLLDAGPHPMVRERYARRMATATGLTWPSAPWLAASDPLVSSADYLRALGRARALHGERLVAAITT
jgi:hypothetical protein